MKTKTILMALAFATLLTTACSREIIDDEIINDENIEQKGYPFPVTVNVTREGDKDATKATYNESTKKLSFSTGDQLFVKCYEAGAGWFAGTLDYVSEGTFTGTIYTQKSYSGTAGELFTAATSAYAALLPADYETYNYFSITEKSGYDAELDVEYAKAFAISTTEKTAKATAIEQFSAEVASAYSNGFALQPQMAILNFTITGLTANTNVTATLTDSDSEVISGTVPTNASGEATFAMGVAGGYYTINQLTLTVGEKDIILGGGSKGLVAGKIYNVKRAVGALPGKFTISNDGGTTTSQVYFSQGNLQAVFASAGSSCIWKFAANQWDYIGSAAANTSINGSGSVSVAGTVDLFGWVGTSSYNNNYGIWNNTTANYYGNTKNESLKNDWGHNAITNGGNTADMWRTLTREEWGYMLSTRSGATVNGSNNVRFAKATIRTDATGVKGLLLFPDGATFDASEASWGVLNDGYENYTTTCTAAQWTALEAKGCVFLPAAGNRTGTTVSDAGNAGAYWTATGSDSKASDIYPYSYRVYFGQTSWGNPQYYSQQQKTYGHSVRLVRAVE